MPSKGYQKYKKELDEAKEAIDSGSLPTKIPTKRVSQFLQILRGFLRKKNLSDDILTASDPDNNGVYIAERKKK